MKYAILSDIHANLDALDAVLADARAQGAGQIVCLGDIVGYGPCPAEALARIRAVCTQVIAGNHDDAVSARGNASAFIDLAADAARRHREALDGAARAWLGNLPYTVEIEGALCTHGDIVDPPEFRYIEGEKDAAANFAACPAQLLFVGHTHVPRLFLVGRSGTVYKTDAQDFTLEDGKRYIVNPGSVGYPREANGRCYSSYVLYDSAERTVAYRFLPFSVASVMQRGPTPKRMRKMAIAALVAVAAVGAGLAAFWLTPRVTVADDLAQPLATRTVPLAADLRRIRANLTLAKGSAPVLLRVSFLDRNQTPLTTKWLTVKKFSEREFSIPDAAAQVVFDALKLKAGDQPVIQSFSPAPSAR
ncbi:MAG: metallophosphoesterase family protein [Kiritimatiellia bacterium]